MPELCRLELRLSIPPNEQIHASMGSVFHGLLMDIVGSDVAAWLHDENSHRPFSQCVYFNKELGVPVWRICTLSEEAHRNIILPVLNLMGERLFLAQKHWEIVLEDIISYAEAGYQELADEVFLAEELPGGGVLNLLTTVSFKRDGHYVILPELYLMFQNLIARWNNLFPENIISAQGLEHELASCCHITKYALHTQTFSVNNGNVYGFCGNIRVKFSGNDMTRRLMNLIFLYANFAGIGIKTALGMGAVDYQGYANPRRSS